MALRPTTDVYNALLEGLYWDGRINTAKRIFNEMQRSAEKFLNERAFASHFPDVVTYILILNGIFQNGKMEEGAGRLENARKLFNHIPRKRLVPNVVTYNTMIRGGKETGKALQFLRQDVWKTLASSDSTVINGGSEEKRLATHCRIFAIC
ncbi:pentatricopeptide repeat-containing protein At5g41170, mitochondrial-like [Papaver somniferum]|uniref:pentatricopeptide repeat-containing protein At5g41170, mitochondrial-like n=1 Tax=Papaver somniferum TaxID=3469 RepID=UPI000E6FD69F|nr:pentatricopeptide repeat-containing protein At5g41170, mitochondrial-like [Papaver somniferum]